MGCLKLQNDYYEGKVIEMTRRNNKSKVSQPINECNSNNTSDVNPDAGNGGNKYKFWDNFKLTLSLISSFGAIVAVVAFFFNMKSSIDVLVEKFDTMSGKVDTMYEYIYIDENSINSKFVTVNEELDELQDQLDIINQALNIKIINVTDEDAISILNNMNETTASISYTMPVFLSSNPVGEDAYGNSYFAYELINETILLTYEEDGKEVYFLGQYNDNCNWEGYCVTNSYNSDGTLFSICESNFNDGQRLDYKSLYLAEDNEWILSNRICDNNVNSGTTINYYYEYETVKNFTTTNVRRTDILYVDNFIDNEAATITKFYSGETLNQRYNDDSGDAYLVKYDTDGTIKTLYVGNFVDGYCEDYTGNAWNIAYSEELQSYFYNTGKFENNNAIKRSLEPITIEEIEKIVSEYDFLCDLKWKQNWFM